MYTYKKKSLFIFFADYAGKIVQLALDVAPPDLGQSVSKTKDV